MAGLGYEGTYTAPSLKGTMIYPGYVGGVRRYRQNLNSPHW